MAFTKWGDRPHWEYDAVRLGSDAHGTWFGLPLGTHVARPGREFRTDEAQVVLVPRSGFVATYYARGGTAPCDLYVDITTVPRLGQDAMHAVDLDLDVVRGWTGRVWVDDEDEFAEHRVRYGYPPEIVDHAVSTCARVRDEAAAGEVPFDAATPARWFAALAEVTTESEETR